MKKNIKLILPVAVIVFLVIAGVSLSGTGSAEQATAARQTSYFKKPNSATMKKITDYSLAYWGRSGACDSGKSLKYSWYNHSHSGKIPRALGQQIYFDFNSKASDITFDSNKIAKSYLDTMAYAKIGGAAEAQKHNNGYCRVYFNHTQLQAYYDFWKRPGRTTLTSNEYICTFSVHEIGHLMGHEHTYDSFNGQNIKDSNSNFSPLRGNQWEIMQTGTALVNGSNTKGNMIYAPGCGGI